MSKFSQYNKFLIAIAGAVLTALVQQFGTNRWVQLLVVIATALGVYVVPNRPQP